MTRRKKEQEGKERKEISGESGKLAMIQGGDDKKENEGQNVGRKTNRKR